MNLHESNTILIPTFSSITLINPDEIIYLKAMQNYCMIFLLDGKQILASVSFGSTMELLSNCNLYQCHRSYAIQVNKVVRYLKNGNTEMEGNIIVPVARRRKVDFLETINSERTNI